eukprot:jgi/Chrzof1/7994/UNPLg00045.t1
MRMSASYRSHRLIQVSPGCQQRTARLATRSGTGSQCKRPPYLYQPNSCSSHMTWLYAGCIPGVKQRSVVW